VTAFAVDTVGQQDTSTSGATARYLVYPGDADPTISDTLFSPTEGTAFTDARIFVSGRAEDDTAMGSVQVAIVNSLGQYMSSSGTFSSTSESWRTAFLNSPGTPGSNFSYTTPVIPSGAYTVRARAVDAYGQVQAVPREAHVTVSAPAGNFAPTPGINPPACAGLVCNISGVGSADPNTGDSFTYLWNFGDGTPTSTASATSHTFPAAGTYTVTLTTTDGWGKAASTTRQVTVTAT
jgi:large repetitive protein